MCDASLAEVQCGLFLDTLSDVNRGAQTRHARVGRVGLYGSATLTAESVVRGRIRYLGGSRELTFSEGPTRGGLQLLCIPFLGLGFNEY